MAGRDGRRLVVTMMHGTQQPRRQWMQGASLLDWGFALPAGTPPVGTLVTSLAEATAVAAAPTPSTGAAGQFGIDRVGQLHAAQVQAQPTSEGDAGHDVIGDLQRNADRADPGRDRPADRHRRDRPVAAPATPEQAPSLCR